MTVSPTVAKSLLDHDKADLSTITSLISGHDPVGYHFKKMDKVASDICQFCFEDIQTPEHKYDVHVAVACYKNRLLEQAYLEPVCIRTIAF